MIIWRSWGILGFLVPGLLGGLLYGLGNSGFYFGLGAFAGSVVSFALGWYLNQIAPVNKLAQWESERRAFLTQLVEAGVFRLDEATPPPSSLQEAHAQADYLFAEEQKVAKKNLFNRSTIFFIPMQWFAIGTAVAGVTAMVTS